MFEYHSNYCVLIILFDFIELIFMANELFESKPTGNKKKLKTNLFQKNIRINVCIYLQMYMDIFT